jgi:phosphatidylglycerophosphate synthase
VLLHRRKAGKLGFCPLGRILDLRRGVADRLSGWLSGPHLEPDLEYRPHAVLLLLAADQTIAGWSLWAAITILCREILVSGLREYLAALKVSVPVTRIAKWKTTIQMVSIAFLLAGPAGDKFLPFTTQIGIGLLWVAAALTFYSGYDYFRAGLKHLVDDEG